MPLEEQARMHGCGLAPVRMRRANTRTDTKNNQARQHGPIFAPANACVDQVPRPDSHSNNQRGKEQLMNGLFVGSTMVTRFKTHSQDQKPSKIASVLCTLVKGKSAV